MLNTFDTIAAIATPRGEGGIAVIRISGDGALSILKKAFAPARKGARLAPSKMLYGYVFDADESPIDEVMAVWFKAPYSYTREDVCEIHTHGGISADMALRRVIELGARPAERGEFTYRAFVNGRVSLSSAEAVMSLISAKSEMAAKAARRELKSGASSKIGYCRERLMELLVLIDAAADFPEEIDEEVTNGRVRGEAQRILNELKLSADDRYIRVLAEGFRVVIAGRPNAGKSSIMNRLLSFERSIVTDIPGTTRDTVNESATIDGCKVILIDTAGIRDTDDTVEKIGVERAKASINDADAVILALDASKEEDEEERKLISLKDERFILVLNKDDVSIRNYPGALKLSAVTGEGFDALISEITRRIPKDEDYTKLTTLRHIEAAKKAMGALQRLVNLPMDTELDLMREDVSEALNFLGEITGENISESAINGIFERFCVGK